MSSSPSPGGGSGGSNNDVERNTNDAPESRQPTVLSGGSGGNYTLLQSDFRDEHGERIFEDPGGPEGAGDDETGEDWEDEDDNDDDDDAEYHDAEEVLRQYGIEIEEEEEVVDDDDDDDEDEDEDEDDEDDEDDDDDNDYVDEGRPIPYLTQRQLNLILQGETLHNVLLSVTDLGRGGGDDGDDDEEEIGRYGRMRRRRQQRDPNRFPKVPSEEGRKLMDSGVFGATERLRADNRSILDLVTDNNNSHTLRPRVAPRRRPVPLRLLDRELGSGGAATDWLLTKKMIAQSMVPATQADMILRYDAPVYLGQFSDDGNFFYSATKDFRVRMYDTSNVNDWHHYKTVVHPSGRWTMTDAALSPDNRWLAFTSMMPQVCLAPTDPNDEGDPYLLDLSSHGANDADNHYHSFAIFSVRFSGDGRELVAGTNASSIIVYDIESRRVLHHIDGHDHDVNAVCFGDRTSPHLLYSGSDDATIKVWDRRSLGDGRPAGAFVGHCEGVTYIDSKGDGRYILSNGKDQTMRLWDLRMAMSTADFERLDPAQLTRYSLYDYRFQRYNDDLYFKHQYDNSVVAFRGHRVERTLIRCHFSPPGSSDGRYVYAASHSGKVYIWNLDATLAGIIDVREATRQTLAAASAEERTARGEEEDAGSGSGGDGREAWRYRQRQRLRQRQYVQGPLCVRDASWHPTAPILVASGFDAESMESGTCSVHSCDIAQDGDAGGREHRLYDERMKPLTTWQPSRRNMSWW
ncbi:WD repeat protein [Niveomyces insectorum RCEF 264]|uniref:WD repeat protein n=1 Tax=Niveomyces insectorum RCEF 264 TaxID=1081102 RepID=A0A167X030_9HYPO|nr:WD repeat protein [Niveomyces insectorum RCEF 264]